MDDSFDLIGNQRTNNFAVILRGVAGAVLGGVVGYFAFDFAMTKGLYMMIIPGVAIGFGCGQFSRQFSRLNGVICAVLAIVLALYVEWHFFPFVVDDSLEFFIMHIHDLRGMTQIMIAVGAYIAYRFGVGR